MKKHHTYFDVRAELPMGDYNAYIDAMLSQYLKENNIVFKKINFTEKNRDLYFEQQRRKSGYRELVIESLIEKYSQIKFEDYKILETSKRAQTINEIRKVHRESIINTIMKEFNPNTDNPNNGMLIKMELFKSFMQRFYDCPYLNWNEISAKKFYTWNPEILKIGKDVLNWKILALNTSIQKILSNLSQDDYNILKLYFDIEELRSSHSSKKTLFVIKEYAGNLKDYYFIKDSFEKAIRDNLEFISTIIWLDKYSTSQKILNTEELEIELSSADYIYSIEGLDVSKDTISGRALTFTKDLGLKVYTNWQEIKIA